MPRAAVVRRRGSIEIWRADPGGSATRWGCGIPCTTASTRSPASPATERSRGSNCSRCRSPRSRDRTAGRRRRACGDGRLPLALLDRRRPHGVGVPLGSRGGRGRAELRVSRRVGPAQTAAQRSDVTATNPAFELAYTPLVGRGEEDEQRTADPEPQPPRDDVVARRDPRPELRDAVREHDDRAEHERRLQLEDGTDHDEPDRDDAERHDAPQLELAEVVQQRRHGEEHEPRAERRPAARAGIAQEPTCAVDEAADRRRRRSRARSDRHRSRGSPSARRRRLPMPPRSGGSTAGGCATPRPPVRRASARSWRARCGRPRCPRCPASQCCVPSAMISADANRSVAAPEGRAGRRAHARRGNGPQRHEDDRRRDAPTHQHPEVGLESGLVEDRAKRTAQADTATTSTRDREHGGDAPPPSDAERRSAGHSDHAAEDGGDGRARELAVRAVEDDEDEQRRSQCGDQGGRPRRSFGACRRDEDHRDGDGTARRGDRRQPRRLRASGSASDRRTHRDGGEREHERAGHAHSPLVRHPGEADSSGGDEGRDDDGPDARPARRGR